MVLHRHTDHSLALRAFSICRVASFYHAKNANGQPAISSASRALASNSRANLDTLLSFVLLDLIT
jgi:hypothetical protein